MKTILAIGILICLSQPANAQLFRRYSQSCPGGVCPTNRPSFAQSYGHWSYPGDIATHLQSTHGQSVAGLSHEQMLDMHDALHEGRSVPKPMQVARPSVQRVVVPKPVVVETVPPIRLPSL